MAQDAPAGDDHDPADRRHPTGGDRNTTTGDLGSAGDASGPHSTDGRVARRERNRALVLDAALELFGEGDTYPTPDEVARRSGVSLRSVYRYFDDSDALLRAAVERQMTRIEPLVRLDVDPTAPLADRATALAVQRRRLHASFAPVMRAATARSAANPVIRGGVETRRRELREQLVAAFAHELDALGDRREPILDALDALTSFEAVDLLVQRGLGDEAIDAAIVEATTALLR